MFSQVARCINEYERNYLDDALAIKPEPTPSRRIVEPYKLGDRLENRYFRSNEKYSTLLLCFASTCLTFAAHPPETAISDVTKLIVSSDFDEPASRIRKGDIGGCSAAKNLFWRDASQQNPAAAKLTLT
ncbi:MAG: hypothetical protein ACI9QL_003910 [Candidatus Omnitrophota bacterium]